MIRKGKIWMPTITYDRPRVIRGVRTVDLTAAEVRSAVIQWLSGKVNGAFSPSQIVSFDVLFGGSVRLRIEDENAPQIVE